MSIQLKENELDGKKIAYHSETKFLVQIGRYKSAYKTRNAIVGNLGQAVLLFNAINIGNGYKKRLVCWEMNKPILARQFSY